MYLAVESNLGSLLLFHLSFSRPRNFLGQYTAKLSYLCKSYHGAKKALNPPYNTTVVALTKITTVYLRNPKKRVKITNYGRNKSFLEFYLLHNGVSLKLLRSLL